MGTDTAKKIRNALKSNGWGPYEISVRNDSYSMGSTVRVRVKKADIALDLVETIARAHQVVRRDESGEILEGGNTFVDVEYENAALDAATLLAQAALNEGRDHFGPFLVDPKGAWPDCASIWLMRDGVGSHHRNCSGPFASETTARTLAELLARRGLLGVLAPLAREERIVMAAERWQASFATREDLRRIESECPELAALWKAVANRDE